MGGRCVGCWRRAVIREGGTRTDAARIGGVGLQIVRDWVLRFKTEGPAGLIDREARGKAPTLTAEHRAALFSIAQNSILTCALLGEQR